MIPKRNVTIRNFDDFVEESRMLPDGANINYAINDPLERRFMEIADKHGVIDQILDDDMYDSCDHYEY